MAKKRKKTEWSPDWAKAKTACRLNAEDVRKAKRLGMSPRSLLKNIPNKQQRWKKPVRDWIRELFEKRFPNESPPNSGGPASFKRSITDSAHRVLAPGTEYSGEHAEYPFGSFHAEADRVDDLEPEPPPWLEIRSLEESAQSLLCERSTAIEIDHAAAMYSDHGAFNE